MDTSELIRNLKESGVIVPKNVEKAMLKVDIADFTNHNSEGFFHDRPVVFLETPSGGIKTISAPHMIATLLDNLELEKGQHIVVYGAKGGYISALIAHVIGEEGKVTILDPSEDVIKFISNNLRGYPTIECHVITENSELDMPELNRVLVTGQILNLPVWLSENIGDGGFAIAPIGTTSSQRLLKLERQGDDFFETDLGSVIFGPLNIKDTIVQTPSPEEMAEIIKEFASSGLVNLVGGCCGTTPNHIRAISESISGIKPRDLPKIDPYTKLSGLEPITIRPDSNFINVGERTNVTGSSIFRKMTVSENILSILELGNNTEEISKIFKEELTNTSIEILVDFIIEVIIESIFTYERIQQKDVKLKFKKNFENFIKNINHAALL